MEKLGESMPCSFTKTKRKFDKIINQSGGHKIMKKLTIGHQTLVTRSLLLFPSFKSPVFIGPSTGERNLGGLYQPTLYLSFKAVDQQPLSSSW